MCFSQSLLHSPKTPATSTAARLAELLRSWSYLLPAHLQVTFYTLPVAWAVRSCIPFSLQIDAPLVWMCNVMTSSWLFIFPCNLVHNLCRSKKVSSSEESDLSSDNDASESDSGSNSDTADTSDTGDSDSNSTEDSEDSNSSSSSSRSQRFLISFPLLHQKLLL